MASSDRPSSASLSLTFASESTVYLRSQWEDFLFVKDLVGLLIDLLEHLLVFDVALGLLHQYAAIDQPEQGLADEQVHYLRSFQLRGAVEAPLAKLGDACRSLPARRRSAHVG